MAQIHTICRKTEVILESYLTALVQASIPSIQVLRRFDPTTQTQPVLKIVASRATFEGADWEYQTGNAIVDVTITLLSNYKDTDAEAHDECMGVVIDNLLASDITAQLNAVDPSFAWYCNRVVILETEQATDEHQHSTSVKLLIKAAPTRVIA